MRINSLACATVLLASLSGTALAQTGTSGHTEKNINNPGSVKSNTEKGMPAKDGIATTGTATGALKGASPDAVKTPPSAATKSGASSTGAR